MGEPRLVAEAPEMKEDSQPRMIMDMPVTLLQRTLSVIASPWMRNRLSILIYHRIQLHEDPLLMYGLDMEAFRWQIKLLKQHFNVLPLGEAVARLKEGMLPNRAVCITFDDGYADNIEAALPILQQYEVSATFFIASGYLDGGRMWNDTVIEAVRRLDGMELDLSDLGLSRYPAATYRQRMELIRLLLTHLKHLPPIEREELSHRLAAPVLDQIPQNLMMSSEQVRRLKAAGMEIGSHTVSHPILASVDLPVAEQEIQQSKNQLEGIIDAPVRFFAYPNGKPRLDYGLEHVKAVQRAGFEAAVTTANGASTPSSDIWQLARFTPWDRSPGRFLLRLLNNCLLSSPEIVTV